MYMYIYTLMAVFGHDLCSKIAIPMSLKSLCSTQLICWLFCPKFCPSACGDCFNLHYMTAKLNPATVEWTGWQSGVTHLTRAVLLFVRYSWVPLHVTFTAFGFLGICYSEDVRTIPVECHLFVLISFAVIKCQLVILTLVL
jgi:hypothetical protein